MEAFYFQLACLIASIGLVGFWIYKSKKEVSQLTEELLDKKIVINELSEHANRIERESNSVVEIKPILAVKKTKKPKKEESTKQKQAKTTSKSKKTVKSNRKSVTQ